MGNLSSFFPQTYYIRKSDPTNTNTKPSQSSWQMSKETVPIIIVFLVIAAVLLFLCCLFRKSGEPAKSITLLLGGGDKSFTQIIKENKLCVIIISLIIIFLILFLIKTCSMSTNNKINEADVSRFTQQLTEAKKIAGLERLKMAPVLSNPDFDFDFDPDPVPSPNSRTNANDITLDDFYRPLI